MTDAARAHHWFARHGHALDAADDGTLPRMAVTQEEYEELKRMGKPWSTLEDGREMWGGVVVEVRDG